MILEGIIVKGIGKGEFFLSLEWVKKQIQNLYGFEPYPGTLNVELSRESYERFKILRERLKNLKKLIPPDNTYCIAQTFPVKIGEIPGCVCIIPKEYSAHPENVVEVIAPVRILDKLNLKIGDKIRIKVSEQIINDKNL